MRIFKGTHYHVDEWDTPVVYIDYRKEFVILQSPQTAIGKARLISSLNPSVYKNYYFSKDINSPINPLTKKCLKREFSDNPAFLENLDKETNLWKDVTFKNAKTNRYLVTEIYKKSK
ncbi:MAG: hypothetical protein NZ480_01890 [Bdellovibrionaceae bacterium]|nr:hypothetical protein [Pseudobdellovibrionaceae bacterium]